MNENPTPPEEPRPSSRNSERLEEARRRLFDRPPEPPFWATPEFRRVGALIFLLLMVGAAGVMIYLEQSRKEHELAQQEAARASAGAPVLPDKVLREQNLATAFQGALADTSNGEDFRETSGYTTLLRELAPYSQADVERKAQRWLDYEGAAHDPDGWRGAWVRSRGLVARIQATKLETPVQGIKDVWRCYLSQPDKSDKVVVDVLTEPPAIQTNYDAWDVEGVFYRTVKFEDNEGRTWELPYLVARSIHASEPPSPLGIVDHPIVLLLAVVGLALFLARLLLLLAKSRRPAPPGAGEHIRRLMTLQQARKTSPPTPPPSS
jgi:hypothetical protein